MRKDCLIALVALICQVALVTARSGEDHWVWRTYTRRERAFKDNDIDRIASSSRNTHEKQQRREPTTRRPLPGEPENDEIEDYVDADPTVSAAPNVGTRQFNPYASGNPFGGFGGPGQPGGQVNGGQFAGGLGGFGGSGIGGGGIGGGSPGVLVGPGGPTGIIGRQPQYPNIYQPGIGFGGGQNGLGFGQGQGQGLGGFPGNFGGFGGSAYPGVGGGFPGAQPGIGLGQGQGQFPGAGSQYPFGGFPGAGTNFNSNQFAAPGGQYPGVGQYPSNQYGGPQYTEGYGLSGFGQGQQGLPPTGFGGNYGASPFGFDEKAPTVAEGKSAKSVVIAPTSVNDKLSKKV